MSSERGLLGAILCAAAFVRLYDLSLMEFRNDAAYWAIEGQRIVGGGYWPLVGQQVGSLHVPLANGPLLSYVTAIAFLLGGPDPRHAAAVIASANVVGVWLTYRLGRRWYGARVGLIAAALTAVAPWLVLYGRMLWPHSLFPFLVPLLLLTLSRALESQRLARFAVTGILLGVGVQLHLSMLPFVATSVGVVLLGATLQALMLVVVGCAVGYAPVLLHDAGTGFATLRTLLTLPSLHAATDTLATHLTKTVWNFTNVLSGQGLWVSKLAHEPYLPSWLDWLQGTLFSALMLAALIAVVRWSRRGRSGEPAFASRADVLLISFVAVPTLYLLAARGQINRHYFLVLYPLPFLLIARGIQLWGEQRRGTNRRFAAALAVVLSLNFTTIIFAYRFLQQSGGSGEYGTAFADKDAAVAHIARQGHFDVHLAGVQEPLPYAFLFGARHAGAIVGGNTTDVQITSPAATTTRRQFRIIESPYHAGAPRDGECFTFRARAVVVLQPCAEQAP